MASTAPDAVVVGSGPNGLTAAIHLARAGHVVRVLEGAPTPGGGLRSAELTLPGFVHDLCSTIHPFGRISPAFAGLDLERHGLRWIEPPASIAHPLDDGAAVLVRRSVAETAAGLGSDAAAYRSLFGPIVAHWPELMAGALAPFHVPAWPPRALRLARFGLLALRPATSLAGRFGGVRARALFAGAAAHSVIGLTEPISGAAGLVMLASAHADGWPFPAGGAERLAEALAAELRGAGGTIETDRWVTSMADLPPHRLALFDTSPGAWAAIAGDRLPGRFRRRLERFRRGAGVFKLDLALDGPIPWRATETGEAATVHLGGTFEEIARAEAEVVAGRHPEQPYVLLVQHGPFDPSRAPAGRATAWAYCHVPAGSTVDRTEAILGQLERFAPGVRDRILATVATTPADLEARNPNDVGGDIGGGRFDLGQLFTRPSWRVLDPYSTPDPAIFLCSSSTPPGGGVHGLPGWFAARSAGRRLGRGVAARA